MSAQAPGNSDQLDLTNQTNEGSTVPVGLDVQELDSFRPSKDSKSAERPKKRQKATKQAPKANISQPARKTRGGKLRDLPEMPLDILLEIFSHLLPLDLLHLIRTTKALRTILLRRSSISVWKDAFSNLPIPPPPCPADSTEPKWAGLLFDSYCHFCSASGIQTILFQFRARCCRRCMREQYMTLHDLYKSPDMLPGFGDSHSTIEIALDSLVWAEDHKDTILIKPSDVQLFTEQYEAAADKEAFLSEGRKQASDVQDESTVWQDWYSRMSDNRSLQLQGKRERRKDAIIEKLKALGWEDEINKLNAINPGILASHPLIKQPKDLTERIWKNIMPGLIEFMAEKKAEIIEQEQSTLIEERYKVFVSVIQEYAHKQHPEVVPPTADIFRDMDGVDAIIDDPSDAPATSESFSPIVERLPAFVKEWRSAKDLELLSLFPTQMTGSSSTQEDDLSKLSLASTFFNCSKCQSSVSYPRVLGHRCLSLPHVPFGDFDLDIDQIYLYTLLGSSPWNTRRHIQFAPKVHAIAREIVRKCGLDPDTATVGDMDAGDYWLGCQDCSEPGVYRVVMRWSTAILHCEIGSTSHKAHISWSLLSEAEISVAKQYEPQRSSSESVRCSQCGHAVRLRFLDAHILKDHDMQPGITEKDLKEGEHYYFPLDSAPHPKVMIYEPYTESDSDWTETQES